MKSLFTFFFSVVSLAAFAQSSPDADSKLKELMEKNSEYHRKTEGEYDGYRIKIHFGIDKAEAREVKQKFTTRYNDILAYEEYKQPNFVIVVGNFKTRLEAFEALKRIQPDFPNAFIIKSKIKPSKP
jgi:hypothetical protein